MTLVTSSSFQIKANSVDQSISIDWKSVDVTLVLTKEVSTCKFNVKNPGGTIYVSGSPVTKYSPVLGDQIDVYETDSAAVVRHKFGGTITEIQKVLEGLTVVAQVTATDWGYKMDGKLVIKSYTNMDPADIVADIVSTYCPAGFNGTTYVQRVGYTIPSIKFNYKQPTKCLQSLASQIGWEWNVDADKNIHFFLANTIAAPFPIDDTTGGIEWPSLDIDQNLRNMKNSVFVIGGVQKLSFTPSNEVDVYLGNGTQLTFPLRYAYTTGSIAVVLNGVAQTVGIANQITTPGSFNVIYDKSNQAITFNVVPPASQKIEVLGTAEIPIIAHAIDSGSILVYGEFQDAIFESQIKSIQEAQMRAKAEILLYGHSVYDVKFYTITPGLEVGQQIILNSAKFGISNYPLTIKRIEGMGNGPNEIRWQVECVGSDTVTFVDIMSTLLQQENSQTQIDNTTLEVLLTIVEAIVMADTIAATGTPNTYVYGAPSAAVIESYSESNQDANGSVYASIPGRGQSFTSGANPTTVLDSCKFFMKKLGSPTGNATAQLFAHTGTYGGTNGIPTGPALATSDVFDVSTLTTSYGLTTFNFSGANRVTLAANTHYFIVISYSGGDFSNNIIMGEDQSSPAGSGRAASKNNSGVWSVDTMFNTDLCFYVYGVSQGGVYNLSTWG